jgi:hypothetical protein
VRQESYTHVEKSTMKDKKGRTFSVNVTAHNPTSLHKHIVTSRRHSPRTHRIRVPRVPADLDGMGTRVGKQKTDNGPNDPAIDMSGINNVQVDQEGKEPDLTH